MIQLFLKHFDEMLYHSIDLIKVIKRSDDSTVISELGGLNLIQIKFTQKTKMIAQLQKLSGYKDLNSIRIQMSLL